MSLRMLGAALLPHPTEPALSVQCCISLWLLLIFLFMCLLFLYRLWRDVYSSLFYLLVGSWLLKGESYFCILDIESS